MDVTNAVIGKDQPTVRLGQFGGGQIRAADTGHMSEANVFGKKLIIAAAEELEGVVAQLIAIPAVNVADRRHRRVHRGAARAQDFGADLRGQAALRHHHPRGASPGVVGIREDQGRGEDDQH